MTFTSSMPPESETGWNADTDPRQVVLTLPPTLTVSEAIAIRQQCQDIYAQPSNPPRDPPRLVLDCQQCCFIDSSGIGALVIVHKLCQTHGTTMVLRQVQSPMAMVLEMTDLHQVFTIEAGPSVPLKQPEAETESTSPPEAPGLHPSVRSQPKRYLDILGALVGLGLLMGLTPIVAVAIKLDDGGPVFFSQTRCSLMGRRFRIWKFRSMVVNAEALKAQVENQLDGPLFKNENDPRITRVGRFLRRTSLDEFPQFWNVLTGDMSLVGTRPPTPDELAQYDIPEWQRLNVRPGMTGEWQVNGRSSITRFEDVIELDLTYQRNWSFRYDVRLILKTILVVFSHRSGAA
jgi:anti-anti-sigma factor